MSSSVAAAAAVGIGVPVQHAHVPAAAAIAAATTTTNTGGRGKAEALPPALQNKPAETERMQQACLWRAASPACCINLHESETTRCKSTSIGLRVAFWQSSLGRLGSAPAQDQRQAHCKGTAAAASRFQPDRQRLGAAYIPDLCRQRWSGGAVHSGCGQVRVGTLNLGPAAVDFVCYDASNT